MPTQSLNDPIDGAELKAIILERISRALDRDSTLANDIAYAGFKLDFNITISYLRSKTAPTTIWGIETKGELADPAIANNFAQNVVVEQTSDSYTTDSPNTAREEHALPIPVLVQTPNGPVRKKVHVNPRKS